jgi:hypothetical protein
VDVVGCQCNINQSRTRSVESHANQRNICSAVNFFWVDRCNIDALEVAIHEWFAVSNVVLPSSLTGLKDIAKIIANIAVASVPYLVANGNSRAYKDVIPEEVDFSATDAVGASAHEPTHASALVC